MIDIRPIQQKDLMRLHEIAFTQEMPEWAKLNAPYFHEYKSSTLEDFIHEGAQFYLEKSNRQGIFMDDEIIGFVSAQWESKETRWLEVGIIIYEPLMWGQGLGTLAFKYWIQNCFDTYPEIERVGFTTWSKNTGMMALGDKLQMKLEATIRKVRFFEGTYYDSIKYGILRSEWNSENNN